METCAGPREYQYDTLRFLLIALVVLGHLLELAEGFPHREFLYAVIYSFHMPAFLFLSGMFARFDRIHYIFSLALPYLLLQTLYTSFVHALGDPYVHVEFSRPQRLLIMCCAASAVFLLFVVAAPRMKRRLPLLTTLGQNSLSIYLLHGFLIQLLRLKFPWLLSGTWQVLAVWGLILLALGNPAVGRCVRFLLQAGWYRRLSGRLEERRRARAGAGSGGHIV